MYPTSRIYFPLNALTTAISGLGRRLHLRMNMQCVRGVAIAAFAVSAACAVAFSQGISNNVASRVTPARLSPPGAVVEDCKTNNPNHILPAGTRSTDLQINGINCIVDGTAITDKVQGVYVYGNVNIYNGGTLTFRDAKIDFHAHSILVEMNGTLATAGAIKGPLTIWLWGQKNDGIDSITCKSDTQCGIPNNVWTSNPNLTMKKMDMGTTCTTVSKADPNYKGLPSSVDCFYQYDVLDAGDKAGAYFGRKVLAVSAGGNLMLQGAKGIRTGSIETAPGDSGRSWVRLATTLNGGETYFDVDRDVLNVLNVGNDPSKWDVGDHIVVTTTDYLSGHTEEFVISKIDKNDSTGTGGKPRRIYITSTVKNPHWGVPYDYSKTAKANLGTGPTPDPNRSTLPAYSIETRAVVALLSRSITIASEGPAPIVARTVNQPYDHFPAIEGNYYGGHTIVRQGFKTYQVQGVEFYQLGQGGVLGRYPVHFHMDRGVPQPVTGGFLGTYVADCSIVDSMTRFITVHATQGVTLARNVGYKSIGHGFYLEDATEINNRLYSNVGVSVRGALDITTNPRVVPGILDATLDLLNHLRQDNVPIDKPKPPTLAAGDQIPDMPPYVSDVTQPSVFWITNTYNDFRYNVAVGAGACGACYWMPPAQISGPSRYEAWTGYASMQKPGADREGAVPLMVFTGNSCSTAMFAIQTISATAQCNGVVFGKGQSNKDQLASVLNTNTPALTTDQFPRGIYDHSQRAKATVCDYPGGDCTDKEKVPACTGDNDHEGTCSASVIDHFTTSFNWAPTNFSAIWLRGWWYLMDNAAITDVQNGGITLISGGGYSRSDAAQGFWSVLKNSILVGNTQPIVGDKFPANAAASNAGPFNPDPKTPKCAYSPHGGNYCLSEADGAVFLNAGFAVNQRLFNIYDGPATEYNNIYKDIHTTNLGTVGNCRGDGWQKTNPGNCVDLGYMNAYTFGVMQYPPTGDKANNCILPNAAIAWKQPNGFYYPPSFNSKNLVFDGVDIRHFVINPLYLSNSFEENNEAIQNAYCTWNPRMFKDSFTDIDRQTELTDIDGSLTGLTANITTNNPQAVPSISVNKDPFYSVPLVTDECASGQPADAATSNDNGATVKTSPYEYLTTALVAECARPGTKGEVNSCGGNWEPGNTVGCSTPQCYGIPLYRQSVTKAEQAASPKRGPSLRMAGQGNAQRSAMTVNRANYYVDTTVSRVAQLASGPAVNVFRPNEAYDIFFVYASKTTKQDYSLFIGANLSQADAKNVITQGRMPLPGDSFPFTPDSDGTWATVPDGGYDKATGILTVKVDLSNVPDTEMDVAGREKFCQPTRYCAWNSNNVCGCKKVGGKCVNASVDDNVCSYATRDIDCPLKGCYGFRITLPGTFPDLTSQLVPLLPLPPSPRLYTDDPYFQANKTVTFVPAASSKAGNCFYQTTPVQKTTENLLGLGSEESPNQ